MDAGCKNPAVAKHGIEFQSMSESRKVIYTIGHSNHTWDKFLDLLRKHSIEVIVDVRSYPHSRFAPWSNRDRMPHILAESDIDYRWMGSSLGGRPIGSKTRRATASIPIDEWYFERRSSTDFVSGIEEVCSESEIRRLAVMCSEGEPRHCHRLSLLSPAFQSLGVEMRHINPKNGEIILGFGM